MATGSTNTTFDHTTDAGFNTWVSELITMLITTLGLTQTADTGQIAFPPVGLTRPATSTAAGYYILRFNDTLQSTLPIFIKVEVGTGAGATTPALWITVGTGSNGSGTLTGLGARVACWSGAAVLSTVTNYTSRACYNAAQGVLWINWKQSSVTLNEAAFDFCICRSVDNTGAPTATAIGQQGSSPTATVTGASGSPWQWYDAATSSWNGPANSGGAVWSTWGYIPYGSTTTAASTIFGTAGQVFPVFQYAPTATVPAYGITNAMALCNAAEIPLGSTVSLTILGSTSLTYISLMPGVAGTTTSSYSITAFLPLRIWQ